MESAACADHLATGDVLPGTHATAKPQCPPGQSAQELRPVARLIPPRLIPPFRQGR